MKVLLLQDVQGHGKKDTIVDVNDGYAKNFLIPKKLAKEATKAVVNEHEAKQQKLARIKEAEKAEAMELYGILSKKSVDVFVRCGEGKMYGSVTTQDIQQALEAQGVVVDKKKISIKDPIKTLGQYEVDVRVYPETVAKLKISVKEKA